MKSIYISVPGYAIVWDNVGKLITRAHQHSEQQNIYAMFAMTMLVKNRVSFRHMEDVPFIRRAATTIPAEAFLPGPGDWTELRTRMETLVSRILVTHLTPFEALTPKVTWHIRHEYTDQSMAKSEVVS